MIETKLCKNCGETKPLSEFHRRRKSSDKPYSWCKTCNNSRANEWRRRNREKANARTRKWFRSNRDRANATHRKWSLKNKERVRGYYRKFKYNLSQAEYYALMEIQGGRCAICKRSKKLFIDHCHRTKTTRSLLCAQCNFGIGCFAENPKFIRAALDYVEQLRLFEGKSAPRSNRDPILKSV